MPQQHWTDVLATQSLDESGYVAHQEITPQMGMTYSESQATIFYGGAVMGAAVSGMVSIMRARNPEQADPCTITANFLSTAKAGPCTVDLQVVKAGRTMSHVTAALRQGDTVILTLTGIFTKLQASPPENVQNTHSRPQLPAAATLPDETNKRLVGLGMGFLSMRFDETNRDAMLMAMSGKDGFMARVPTTCWCSLTDGAPMGFSGIPLLVDIPALDFWSFLASSPDEVWDATISLTVHFLKPPTARWMQIKCESPYLNSLWHEMHVQVWDEDGDLVCTSTQLQTLKTMSRAGGSQSKL